jgi:hypothetical protein
MINLPLYSEAALSCDLPELARLGGFDLGLDYFRG